MDSSPPAAPPAAPAAAPPAALAGSVPAPRPARDLQASPADGADPLGAEVRESLLLLALSLLVTVGLAGAVSAVLSLLA